MSQSFVQQRYSCRIEKLLRLIFIRRIFSTKVFCTFVQLSVADEHLVPHLFEFSSTIRISMLGLRAMYPFTKGTLGWINLDINTFLVLQECISNHSSPVEMVNFPCGQDARECWACRA